MKRMQWLAEKVRELDEQDFAEFRRWFLAYHVELESEGSARAARHHAVDPRIVEALTEYGAVQRAP